MIIKEDAIKQALNYASSRLGIFGNSSIAESIGDTGKWNVSIVGKQEEEMLMVTVKLTVCVYEDSNGVAKCKLAMPPFKTEDLEGELTAEKDFFAEKTLPEKPVQKEPKTEKESFVDSFPG